MNSDKMTLIATSAINVILNVLMGYLQFRIATEATDCRRTKGRLWIAAVVLQVMHMGTVYFLPLWLLQPLYVIFFAGLLIGFFRIRGSAAAILSLLVILLSMMIDYLLFLTSDIFSYISVKDSNLPYSPLVIVMKLIAVFLLYVAYRVVAKFRTPIRRFLDQNNAFRLIGGHITILLLIVYINDNAAVRKFVEGEIIHIYGTILFVFLAVYSIYNLVRSIQIYRKEFEYEYNQKYIDSLESSLYRLRAFRHDISNILSQIHTMAAMDDREALLRFMDEISGEYAFVRSTSVMNKRLRKVPEIYSILLTKMAEAECAHTSISVDVQGEGAYRPVLSTTDFSRILGILLDNAIEASAQLPGQRNIAFIIWLGDAFSVEILNAVQEAVEIDQIEEDGYTTKPGHSGFGLYEIEQIITKYRCKGHDVRMEYRVENKLFSATLTVK
jgi:two-component system sensor histidine kinase AgrC